MPVLPSGDLVEAMKISEPLTARNSPQINTATCALESSGALQKLLLAIADCAMYAEENPADYSMAQFVLQR